MKNNFKNFTQRKPSTEDISLLIEYIKTKGYYYNVVKEEGKTLSVISIINRKTKRKIQLIVEVEDNSYFYYVRVNLDGTGRLSHVYTIEEIQYNSLVSSINLEEKLSLKQSLILYRK